MAVPESKRGRPYRDGAICAVEVCEKVVDRRGLCRGHYMRFLRFGDPGETPLAPRNKALRTCVVDRCTDTRIRARGLCHKHYMRDIRGAEMQCDKTALPGFKKIRQELGLSSREFARIAGIPGHSIIWRIETGKKISHRNVAKVVAAIARIQKIRRKVGAA